MVVTPQTVVTNITNAKSAVRAEVVARAEGQVARWFMWAIVAGILWRVVRFALYFELTGDEAGIVRSVMERSYAGLLEPLSYSNVSPPMFLWMTKILDSVFHNEWGLRLVPFLAGIAAVAIFALICRRLLGGAAGWVSLAVLCVTHVPVTEGTRAKGYTIDLLVAAIILWMTLRWLLEGRKSRWLAALAICAPVFVWFSYTAVFMMGGVALVLAAALLLQVRESGNVAIPGQAFGWKNVASTILFLALAGGSVITLYVVNVRPGIQASLANGLSNAWSEGYPPRELWKIPAWFLNAQTGRGFAWPTGDNHFRSILTFALWTAGLIVWWRRRNRLFWILLVAPQFFLLVAACLHKYPYLQNPRLCIFLGPEICVFMGAGTQYLIDTFAPAHPWRWYRLISLLLIICAFGGMARDLVMRTKEIRGPGIRSLLADAAKITGPKGQFVILNDVRISSVSAYYLQRVITQKVWNFGEMPAATTRGRLALVAVATRKLAVDTNALIVEFENRRAVPVRVVWSGTAHEVLLDNKDSLYVWVCE